MTTPRKSINLYPAKPFVAPIRRSEEGAKRGRLPQAQTESSDQKNYMEL